MCANILPLIHASKFVHSSVPVFTCTRHTIYVHLERSARIDRNDAPGTHVITNRSCNEPLLYKRVRDCSWNKKKKKQKYLKTHAGITRNSVEFGSSNWKEVRIIVTLLLLSRMYFFLYRLTTETVRLLLDLPFDTVSHHDYIYNDINYASLSSFKYGCYIDLSTLKWSVIWQLTISESF